MIKKISSWVFGSFFRTMGRFFFFLFFGFLVAMIIQKNDWSSIHWTDLFGLEYVKADTYASQWIPNSALSTNWGTNWTNKGSDSGGYYTVSDSISTSESPSNYWFRFQDSNNSPVSYNLNGVEYITFTVKMNIQNQQNITIDNNQVSCQYSYNQWQSTGEYYQSAALCTIDDSTLDLSNVQYGIDVNYWFNNSPTQLKHCDIISMVGWNLNVQCPVSTDNISGIRITVSSNTPNYLHFNTGYYFTYTKKLSGTQQIIDNQNQNTNQTISTITDTNTTEANTTATNFFSNFSSQDNGGISSIITAPLQAISGLVSATCVQIELPIPYLENKTLILPCMSSIYQQHFGQLFTLYQTIIFGAIAYRMLVSLFMMIQGFKNPDDDKIEVVDL